MAKISKNKESAKEINSAKVREVEEFTKASTPKKKQKDYTNVPAGVGGQFVDIGNGVRVPVSEFETK